jgi:hypothetical protein
MCVSVWVVVWNIHIYVCGCIYICVCLCGGLEYIYIYIYIYRLVCVCVCVDVEGVGQEVSVAVFGGDANNRLIAHDPYRSTQCIPPSTDEHTYTQNQKYDPHHALEQAAAAPSSGLSSRCHRLSRGGGEDRGRRRAGLRDARSLACVGLGCWLFGCSYVCIC